jgi:hypothetical protein
VQVSSLIVTVNFWLMPDPFRDTPAIAGYFWDSATTWAPDCGRRTIQDHCTHRGGSLADGVLICGTVQCLWHGSQFDTKTGQVRAGPAKEPIKTYTVDERDGEVRLKLSNVGM